MEKPSTKFRQPESNNIFKKAYIMTKLALFQGCIDIHKSINVMHHIKKLQDKKPYDYLNRHRESLWRNSTPIYDKKKNKLQKAGIEGIDLNIKKAIYNKPQQTLSSMVKNWKHFL